MANRFNIFNSENAEFVTPGKQLQNIAAVKPLEPALVYVLRDGGNKIVSWQELHVYSNKLAWYMLDKGLTEKSKVLVAYPNCIEHIIANFAIWKIGACYVPVSSKMPESELVEVVKIVKPPITFFDTCVMGCDNCISRENFYAVIENYPEHMPKDTVAIPNKINMSGGTSGVLKLMQQNFPSGHNCLSLQSWFSMSGQDFNQRTLLTGALFHGAPHTAATNALFAGGTLYMTESLRPEAIVSCIRDCEIEHVQMVPTLMYRILKIEGLKKSYFDSLKALYHTGGYCSAFLKQKWIDLTSAEKIYELYSMSEVIGMTFIRGDEWLQHRGSVGRPLKGLVSIRDEDYNELPPLVVGEIYMCNLGMPNNVEYLNAKPLEAKEGGYKSVGDLGYLDADGYLYFVDRRNDMIVTGGENVFASEVENVLIMNDDVLDTVVIGIPDEEWGRRIHAIVESKEGITEAQLKRFMEKFLPNYKIPKTFEFIKEIPRKESGKVNRKELKERVLALANMEEGKVNT